MRKFIALCVLFVSLASCSLDDSNSNFYYEILPIESVVIPDEFTLGETYEIKVSYLRPSSCYIFNDFYYQSNLNQRTIAIVTTVYEDISCTQAVELVEVSFNFIVNNTGTYVFKFWQGEDESGNDMYYIVEVPVVE
ncbi:hypothetical protein OE09_0075 [Flavobacteriaceae bacterium MAR_2010_72]|nr:hypothetical protein OE09_0075 [Flavobacteriaceae bacterium MAR_2010_72]TVZ58221.1 hypothetical protein NA63_0717 [Flavobacteriaceae bacterium MAR_2010_105]